MGIDSGVDLRAMVREVLREAIAARAAPPQGAQAVSVACDADLQALIARLAAPGGIEAVRAGTLKFTLAGAAAPRVAGAASPQVAGAARPFLDGVVSERKLLGIAAGTTVALTSGAVLTPMAKDVARRLGLKFERMA